MIFLTGHNRPPASAAQGKVITYIGSNTDGTDGSSFTFSAESIGSAFSGRAVLVGIYAYANAGGTPTVSSATIGGVSATILAQATSNIRGVGACFGALVPTGSTADIAITFSASVDRCGIDVLTLSGGDLTTVDTDTNATVSTSAAVSVTGGQAVIMGASVASAPVPGDIVFTTVTEVDQTQVENANNVQATAILNGAGASTSSTISCDAASVSSVRWAVAF